MRSHISLKSNTYTESLYVYTAGISGKVVAHYPGRSAVLLCATVAKKRQDETAEVSLSLVSLLDEILKFQYLTKTAVIRNRTSGGVRGGG